MSKLIYCLSLFILSLALPRVGYSSAIPVTQSIAKQQLQKKTTKKKRLQHKRKKGIKKTQSVLSGLLTLLAVSIPIAGIVLFIVGLALQIPGLWIAGLIILGILLLLIAALFILMATSGPWE